MYNFVRGFEGAYNWEGLYLGGGGLTYTTYKLYGYVPP